MDEDGKVFLDYMPKFSESRYQYHVIITMKATSDAEKDRFR